MKAKPRGKGTRIGAKKGWHSPCHLYPNKTRFKDHVSAVEALHNVQNSTNSGRKPFRAYECACGGFHLSSQEE